MAEQNGSNGHHSQQLAHIIPDTELPDVSLLQNKPNSFDNPTDAIETLGSTSPPSESSASVSATSNAQSDNNEKGPSFIPVAINQSLKENSSVVSTPIESQNVSSLADTQQQIPDLNSISSNVDSERSKINEETQFATPAIPPHKTSPDKSEKVESTKDSILSTTGGAQNPKQATDSEQLVSRNENGAIPKPKAGKPRSRNRHKR